MTEHCDQIEPLLTAWVDGEIGTDDRVHVERHVGACATCAARASRERTVRDLLQARRGQLTAETAPPSLRMRLEAGARAEREAAGRASRREWRRVPAAIAATLVLAFSGWTLHELTVRSTTVLAAQLAADHVKCHLFGDSHGTADAAATSEHLAERYGFAAKVPPGTKDGRLRLVGAQRCLTGEGTNAHILYRADGRPVSLYLVPEHGRAQASVDVLGKHAVVWSRHNGTYVLVTDGDLADVAALAGYMQRATE